VWSVSVWSKAGCTSIGPFPTRTPSSQNERQLSQLGPAYHTTRNPCAHLGPVDFVGGCGEEGSEVGGVGGHDDQNKEQQRKPQHTLCRVHVFVVIPLPSSPTSGSAGQKGPAPSLKRRSARCLGGRVTCRFGCCPCESRVSGALDLQNFALTTPSSLRRDHDCWGAPRGRRRRSGTTHARRQQAAWSSPLC
jgi:hypothetical protein